jgi:haloacetate dehalogenase
MKDFDAKEVQTERNSIFVRVGGHGPPILLLHGFSQTHLMWRDVAPILARDFTVVTADLRGYGRSGCPPSTDDHSPYSKRAMAQEMVLVMEKLGYSRFSVVGHDRGGRVAYRLALDHPDRIQHLAVLDIVPTNEAWKRADARFALDYWPWSLLAQAEPFPERILTTLAEVIVDEALGGWGSPLSIFPADVRSQYADALRDPTHAHAICEEYRAAAATARENDAIDSAESRRIVCPLLVLWSARGSLNTWYAEEGGPLALWRQRSNKVRGEAFDAGHLFS